MSDCQLCFGLGVIRFASDKEMQLIYAACPLCGSNDSTEFLRQQIEVGIPGLLTFGYVVFLE